MTTEETKQAPGARIESVRGRSTERVSEHEGRGMIVIFTD